MSEIKKGKIIAGAVEATPTKEAFAALIEAYAKRNPTKYALKKDALAKKLASL